MGLFTGLITLPLAPVRSVAWLAECLLEKAEQQLYDPAVVRGQIAEIEAAREAGDLSEDEATLLENELLGRMMAGRSNSVEGGDGAPRAG